MQRSIELGQLVRSQSGRDKDKYFLVLSWAGKFLYVADGKAHKVGKPKKKNKIHLVITKLISRNVQQKLRNGISPKDQELQREIAQLTGTLKQRAEDKEVCTPCPNRMS